MDVHIQSVVGTVRAIDGDALLTPQTLERIVQSVLMAIDEKQRRDRGARSDTKVSAGVAADQEHGA